MKLDPARLIADMKSSAFAAWRRSTVRSALQARQKAALAGQNGLFVTCGSDSHGAKLPRTHIDKDRQECEKLKAAQRLLLGMVKYS